MPKIYNTKKQRREELKERLTPEYLEERTCVFSNPMGGQKLDPYTVEQIKKSYKMYFNSWIKHELEELYKTQ